MVTNKLLFLQLRALFQILFGYLILFLIYTININNINQYNL